MNALIAIWLITVTCLLGFIAKVLVDIHSGISEILINTGKSSGSADHEARPPSAPEAVCTIPAEQQTAENMPPATFDSIPDGVL